MSQQIDSTKTFTSAEALARYRRVKLTTGTTVSYSDAGEDFIGVTQRDVAITTPVAVRFPQQRTCICTAAGAVTAGAAIYGAADGKVDDAAVGIKIGYALEAALADGDEIECILDKNAGEAWS